MEIALVVILCVGTLLSLIIAGFRFHKTPTQGQALIVTTTKDAKVTFTGRLVLPFIHRAETIDLSTKTISIERRGTDGLICKDNIRADVVAQFFVRVNRDPHDILKVAQTIGCTRSTDQESLEELFVAKFSEALKTATKRVDFDTLLTERDMFRDETLNMIGNDLNGYCLDDLAIDYIEQTPLEFLDPDNILDAQGRQKIIERTSQALEEENLRKNQREMNISSYELERMRAVMAVEKEVAECNAQHTRVLAEIQLRMEQNTAQLESERHWAAEMQAQQVGARAVAQQREQKRLAEWSEDEKSTYFTARDAELKRLSERMEAERKALTKKMSAEASNKDPKTPDVT